MPGIDRSTRAEVITRFRAEFEISQPDLGEEFGISISTVQRFEQQGAPQWMMYALIGLAVLKRGVEPMEVRRLQRALHLGMPRVGRLTQVFAPVVRSSWSETSDREGRRERPGIGSRSNGEGATGDDRST